MTETTPLLEVVGLRGERDERVLFEDLDFAVHPGEIVQVAGPNGSGKTTLLRALAGLSTRCTGAIRWRGQPIAAVGHEFQRESLYIGHDAAIKLALTPVENLRWYCALAGDQAEAPLEAALARFELGAFGNIPAQHLSAGQRRRVGLSRLLLSSAVLWILDEPFTAIDAAGVACLEAMMAAHTVAGGAVLLTTHQRPALDRPIKRVELGQ